MFPVNQMFNKVQNCNGGCKGLTKYQQTHTLFIVHDSLSTMYTTQMDIDIIVSTKTDVKTK